MASAVTLTSPNAFHRFPPRTILILLLLLVASRGSAAQDTSPPADNSTTTNATDAPPLAAAAPNDTATGDDEGYEEATPEAQQLVARLERLAGKIKNPWEVLLHLNELFPAGAGAAGLASDGNSTAAGGAVRTASATVSPLADGCPATGAEMRREVSLLAYKLQYRQIKYTIMARFFRNIAKSARKSKSDLSYLGCRTYILPTNAAFTTAIAKGASDFKLLLLAPLYNILNGTYHFNKLRKMRHGKKIPTMIPNYPISKYFTIPTPLDVLSFGGSFVALGTPGAKTPLARLGWAEIKDRDIYWGKYLAVHGVSTLVIPRIKLKN